MKRTVALLAAVCLLLGCVAGCRDDGSGKGFRFPISAQPRQLDPQVSTDEASLTLISVLFEGLARLDAAGEAIPGAADWTVSADGLTYTFALRESYWSTLSVRGTETPWDEPVRVTADDFLFGFQRVIAPQTDDGLAEQFSGIVNAREIHAGRKDMKTLGVQVKNDDTLEIRLEKADPRFPARLAAAPFMPCHREFFTYTAGRYGLGKDYVLTNGPFRLTLWEPDVSLLLYKNEHYHGAAEVLPEAVRFVIAPEDAAKELTAGHLDAVPLSAAEAERAAQAGAQTVALEDSIRSVWFNTAAGVLKNADIRRALRDSVEWEAVYEYLTGIGEQPATGYIAPAATVAGEPYRTADNALVFKTNVAAALKSLETGLTALYPGGDAALPRLTVLAADDEESANLARYLVQSWQKNLKVYTKLHLVSEAEVSARLNGGDYQIAIAAVTAPGLTGAENLSSYTTGAVGNVTGLASAAVDKAAAAALVGGRAELTKLEQTVAQACPSLPISFPRRYYGVAKGIEGITVRPFNGGSFGCVYDFMQAKKYD